MLIDQALLRPCPDLPQLQQADDGTAAMGELVLADVASSGQYLECQRLHQGLIEAVKIK